MTDSFDRMERDYGDFCDGRDIICIDVTVDILESSLKACEESVHEQVSLRTKFTAGSIAVFAASSFIADAINSNPDTPLPGLYSTVMVRAAAMGVGLISAKDLTVGLVWKRRIKKLKQTPDVDFFSTRLT